MLVRIAASWDGGDIDPDPGGFVHLSQVDQVPDTVRRHWGDARALVFLVVDEAALPARALRLEDTTGHGAHPHLYATLPAAAVRRVVPWRASDPIVL